MTVDDINIVMNDMETYISALEEHGEGGLAEELEPTLDIWDRVARVLIHAKED